MAQSPGGGGGLGITGRAGDPQQHGLGGTLGVVGHLQSQITAGLSDRRGQLVRGRRAGPAVCEQQHGVVRGLGAVDGQPVEAAGHRLAQDLLQLGGLGGGVSGEDGQHGGHVGLQHGGPLGDAADGEAVARNHHLLAHRVGGHHRPGRLAAPVSAPGGHHPRDAGGDDVHGQLEANETRGADQHVAGVAPQGLSGDVAHRLGVGEALRSGGGVGVAAVENDRGGPPPGALQVARG